MSPFGFVRAGVPAAQAYEARGLGLEIVPVATLREAIDVLLDERVSSTPVAEEEEEARS